MASKVPDENPCNTAETEEETIAFQKKRSRRVSFADREITSVHIFNRDEEYESTPDSNGRPSSERKDDLVGLFRDLAEDDDADGEDGEDVLNGRSSFLRPIQSPSPGGSSTLGSAASNDEENFFGPVSANFIRPAHLFDSAASDENHDITMDSTAFSMHFRSLLRSESGDLKTPTMEEKMLSQINTPSGPENLMVLTREKHLMGPSPLSFNNTSGGRDSDMSLVGENDDKYDYGKLPPALEALLADGGKDVPVVSACDSIDPELLRRREVSMFHDSRGGHIEVEDYGDSELHNHDNQEISAVGVSVTPNESHEASGPSTSSVFDGTIHDNPPNVNNDAAANASPHHQIQNANQPEIGDMLPEVVVGTGTSMLSSDGCTPVNSSTGAHLLNSFKQFKYGLQTSTKEGLEDKSLKESNCHDEPCGSPIAGSISSLSSKQQKILMNVTNTPRHTKFATPSPRSLVSFSSNQNINPSGCVPPVLSSNHKLELSELSPCASTVDDRIQLLKLMLSNSLTSKALPLNSEMQKSTRTLQNKHVDFQIMNLEKVLCDADQEGQNNSTSNLGKDALGDSKDVCNLIENGETGHAQDGICKDQLIHIKAMMVSPSQLFLSGKNGMTHFHTSNDSVGMMPVASEPGSSAMKITFDCAKNIGEGNISGKLMKRLDQGLLSQTEHQRSPSRNLMQHDYDKTCFTGEVKEESELPRPILNECSPCKTPPRKMPILSPTVKKSKQSHQNKMQQSVSDGNDLQLFVATDSSSSNIQHAVDRNLRSNVSHSLGHVEETLNSSCRKRTCDELNLGNADHVEEIGRIQQSPKVLKVLENHSSFVLECSDGNNKEKKKVESVKARMNLTEVLPKLLADTNQLLPSSIKNMNIRLIDLLGDILVHRQKLNATETICFDIWFRVCDQSSDMKHKRVAEVRSFLSKIVYEKVKLQLMCVKHERLQKQVELLRAEVQQSLRLKSNCFSLRSLPGGEETEVNQVSRVASSENKVATDKVTKMKSEIEDLERKINTLTSSFHLSSKLKGNQSSTDTIVLLNKQLNKRNCCRLIRNDIQLWEIEDLQNGNGHHYVVLNYRGFISQRITSNTGAISSIVVSNRPNDMSIMKNFPNMAASFAFAFVFSSEFNEKFVGPMNLAHETQRTSLLLSNLLDVVEEVRLARVEIRNLVQTSFHSSTAGRLELQLIFCNLISCDKLIVDLDLTCVKCGVYPTDVQPSWVPHSSTGFKKSKLTDEIRAAVENLRVGFRRIIRLCGCISQVLESSGK